MSPAAADLATSLLDPIPGPNPCGAFLDIDAEDDLLWLQDTIEKTTTFGQGPVDWPGVLERSTRLFGRSKDWILACYIARATYQADGLPGLAAGLDFLKECVGRYWPQMHPGLPAGQRKRANLLDWLVTGLADDLGRRTAGPSDLDLLKRVRESLSVLDERLDEGLGKSYPGVRLLRDALSALEEGAQSAEAPGPAVEEALAAPVSDAAAPQAPVAEEFPPLIDGPEKADAVLGKCRQAIYAAADALQAADPAAPRPYRLRRLAAWMTLVALPSATGRRTVLIAPAKEEPARLRALAGRDARTCLEQAEASLRGFPLWLDLQQIAWSALQNLGPAQAAARDVVAQETAGLLRRLPGLRDLEFASGEPLADDETRAWFDAELAAGEAAAAEAAPPTAAGDGPLAEAAARAAELAKAGEVEKSLQVFQEGVKGIVPGRERFLWWLQAARHCSHVGETALALDLLEGLEREAAEKNLEAWEPGLYEQVLRAAVALGRKGKAKKGSPLPIVAERMPKLGQRLARLDLIAALRISKER